MVVMHSEKKQKGSSLGRVSHQSVEEVFSSPVCAVGWERTKGNNTSPDGKHHES